LTIARTISLCAWAAIAAAWVSTGVKPRVTLVPPMHAALDAPTPMALHPHGLSLVMQPPDLWAIANLRFKELPPVEYDRPYEGALLIIDVNSEEKLRQICGHPPKGLNGDTMVGCARPGDPATIYLGPIPARAGLTRNIVIRHELGHLNGWSAAHEGMR